MDCCVCCGKYVAEGSMICVECRKSLEEFHAKERETIKNKEIHKDNTGDDFEVNS